MGHCAHMTTSVLYESWHMQIRSSCVRELVCGTSACIHISLCGHMVDQKLFMHVQHLHELTWTCIDMI